MKKNIIKKILGLAAAVFMTAAVTAGCSGSGNKKEGYTVGVIQYGSHSSLDNCYQGIKEALEASDKAETITVDLQNGNFDSSTCDTIAKNMVAKKYDMIIAIATPAAVSAYAAAVNSNIPVIFCAVSDPVQAQLVDDVTKPGRNCTGTSDVLPLESQLELITTLQPEVRNIGILYTTSEANSVSQLKTIKELAPAYHVNIVEQGVQTAADIPQAIASLLPKVDCVNNFTDNNVVNNLTVLLEQAEAAGKTVYGSEVEQVKKGCVASVSIDYVALGRTTGDMALEVLGGADPAEMAVRQISQGTPVINTDVVARLKLNIPESYKDAELVVTATEESEQ